MLSMIYLLIKALAVCYVLGVVHLVAGAQRVDGNWGQWTNYSECSHTCGFGTQSRWRYCNDPAPSHNGHFCVGEHHETRPCHDRPCPSKNKFLFSSMWYCNSPHPANGGLGCHGDNYDVQSCATSSCPGQGGVVNGGWGEWSTASACTHSCGGGTQNSYRWCDHPRPSGGGHDCTGNDIITLTCNTGACPCTGSLCPVNGGWGRWTDYAACSVSCGTGTQTRYRYCNSPHPAHGGKYCVGDGYDTQNCQLMDCPVSATVVDGGWTHWSIYSACSKSCGTGYQSRHRTCDNPTPSATGQPCVGVSEDQVPCHTEPCPCSGTNCPVNGGWGDWLPYSQCSHTCGTGTQTRWRYCNNPRPSHGGLPCPGSQTDTQSCHLADCAGPSPVDGGWTTWSSWAACTQTCGSATHSRQRTCTNPAPAHGGSYCSDVSSQTQSCQLQACPADACGTTLVSTTTTKIVGGKLAVQGQFPWQISLRYYGEHICGGTLISDQWVLTAAHCFEDVGLEPNRWTVGVGLHDQKHVLNSNIIHVAQVFVHEQHDSKLEKNDIALLKLSKRLDITGKYIRPACLPQSQDAFEHDPCVASGWGATYYGQNMHLIFVPPLNFAIVEENSSILLSNIHGDFSVEVFVDVTKEEARKIANQHNAKSETLPVTFKEKVRQVRVLKDDEVENFSTAVADMLTDIMLKLFRTLQSPAFSEKDIHFYLSRAREMGLRKASVEAEESRKRKVVKNTFRESVQAATWEEAVDSFPNHTKEATLEPFCDGKTY